MPNVKMVVGVFDTIEKAENAVERLLGRELPPADLSLIVSNKAVLPAPASSPFGVLIAALADSGPHMQCLLSGELCSSLAAYSASSSLAGLLILGGLAADEAEAVQRRVQDGAVAVVCLPKNARDASNARVWLPGVFLDEARARGAAKASQVPNPFNPTREAWEGYSFVDPKGRTWDGRVAEETVDPPAVTDPLAFMDVGAYFAARLAGRVDPELCGIPQRTDNLIQLAKEIVESPIVKAAAEVVASEDNADPAYYQGSISKQDSAVRAFRDLLSPSRVGLGGLRTADREHVALPASLVIKRMIGPVPPSVVLKAEMLLFEVRVGLERHCFTASCRQPVESEQANLAVLTSLSYKSVVARVTFMDDGNRALLDREISLGVQAPQAAIARLLSALREVRGVLEQAGASQFLADEQEGQGYKKPALGPKEPLI